MPSTAASIGCGPFQLSALDMLFTFNAIKNSNSIKHKTTAKEQRSSRVFKIRLVTSIILATLLLWIFLPIDLSAHFDDDKKSLTTSAPQSISDFFINKHGDSSSSSSDLLLNLLQLPQVKSRFPSIVKFSVDNALTPTNTFLVSSCVDSSLSSQNVSLLESSNNSLGVLSSLQEAPRKINQTYLSSLNHQQRSNCSIISESWLNGSVFCDGNTSPETGCTTITSTSSSTSSKLMYSSSAQFLVLFNSSGSSSNKEQNVTFVVSRNKIYGGMDESLSYFSSSSSSTFTAFGHDVKQVTASTAKTNENDALISATLRRYVDSSSSLGDTAKAFIITRFTPSLIDVGSEDSLTFVSITELDSNKVELFISSPITSASTHEDNARAFLKTLSLILSIILLIYLVLIALEDDTINNGWSSSTKSVERSKQKQHHTSSSSATSISLFLLSVPLLVTQLVFISDPTWFLVIGSSSAIDQINPTVTGIFGNNAVRWFDLIFRTWVVPVLALLPFWSNAEEINDEKTETTTSKTTTSSSSPSISELEEEYGKISGKLETYMIVKIFKTHVADAFRARGSFWFVPLCVSFFTFALHIVESLAVAETNHAVADPTSMLCSSSCSSSSSSSSKFVTSNSDQSDDNAFFYTLIPRTPLTASSSSPTLDSRNGFAVFGLVTFLFQFCVVLSSLIFILFGWNYRNINNNDPENTTSAIKMKIYNIRSFTTRRFLSIKWGVECFLVPILVGELFLMFWTELFVPMNLFRVGDRMFLSNANVSGLSSGGQIYHSLMKVTVIILILHPLPQFLLQKVIGEGAVARNGLNRKKNPQNKSEDDEKQVEDESFNAKQFWRQPASHFLHQKKILIGTSIGDTHERKHPEENLHPISQAVPSTAVMICDDEEMFDLALATSSSSTSTATASRTSTSKAEERERAPPPSSSHATITDQTTISDRSPQEEHGTTNTTSSSLPTKRQSNCKSNTTSHCDLSPQQIAALPRPAQVLDFSQVRQDHLIVSDASSLVVEEAVANAFVICDQAMRSFGAIGKPDDDDDDDDRSLKSKSEQQQSTIKRCVTGNVPFHVSSIQLESNDNSSAVSSSSAATENNNPLSKTEAHQRAAVNDDTDDNKQRKKTLTRRTTASNNHQHTNEDRNTVTSSSSVLSCFALPEIIQVPNPYKKIAEPSFDDDNDERLFREKLENEARRNATQFLFVVHDNDENCRTGLLLKSEDARQDRHRRNDNQNAGEESGNVVSIQVKPSAQEEEEENDDDDDDDDDCREDNDHHDKKTKIPTSDKTISSLAQILIDFCTSSAVSSTLTKRRVKFWFMDRRKNRLSSSSASTPLLKKIAHDVLSSFVEHRHKMNRSLKLESAVIIDHAANFSDSLIVFPESSSSASVVASPKLSSNRSSFPRIFCMKLISDLKAVLVDETENVKPTCRISTIGKSTLVSIDEVPILRLTTKDDDESDCKAQNLFAVPSDFVLELMGRGF